MPALALPSLRASSAPQQPPRQPQPLPALREELTLHPGPSGAGGVPTWTLCDPIRNRFFHLGWPAFEILAHWEAGASLEAVADAVNRGTPLEVRAEDVADMLRFLESHNLVQAAGPAGTARLVKTAEHLRIGWGTWLLHNYLFLRLPLTRPDRFLARTVGWVAWLGSRWFRLATLGALGTGLFLIYRQWQVFEATLVDTITWSGALNFALTLTVVKVVHEFAHAWTAKYQGCRVPTMGVALMVLWPVLYTDVNDAWKLPDRRRRLWIGGAGVLAELTVAAWATLAWAFLPPGSVRDAAFLLATVTWISSVLINLSPFMRFDGYFLLMDALNVPNLHPRAFAFGRWWLRELVFGAGLPRPEQLPRWSVGGLVGFAIAIWLYRLMLFLGIAALVYSFFIKAVGIMLFLVEIGWFVLLPMLHELREWRRRWPLLREGRLIGRSVLVAATLLLAFCLPWHTAVEAPAVLKAGTEHGLYLPGPARLSEQHVQEGQVVRQGDILFVFDAPDARHRLAVNAGRITVLEYELASVSLDTQFRDRSLVLRQELATAVAERVAISEELGRLTLTAPAAGIAVDLLPDLRPGLWLSPRDRLITLRSTEDARIDAFVPEDQLGRITLGDAARFYPEPDGHSPLPCQVSAVDPAPVRILSEPLLAVSHGGPLLTRPQGSQHVLDASHTHLRLIPAFAEGASLSQTLRGTVRISGQAESVLARVTRSALIVLIREWGG